MSSPALLKIASGERLIIYAIILALVDLFWLRSFGGFTRGSLFLVAVIMAEFGLLRLGTGLGYPVRWRFLIAICFCIPLLGLLVPLIVTGQGMKALRAGGVKVGLLEVWKEALWGRRSPDR